MNTPNMSRIGENEYLGRTAATEGLPLSGKCLSELCKPNSSIQSHGRASKELKNFVNNTMRQE